MRLLILALFIALLAGCGQEQKPADPVPKDAQLPAGAGGQKLSQP